MLVFPLYPRNTADVSMLTLCEGTLHPLLALCVPPCL